MKRNQTEHGNKRVVGIDRYIHINYAGKITGPPPNGPLNINLYDTRGAGRVSKLTRRTKNGS